MTSVYDEDLVITSSQDVPSVFKINYLIQEADNATVILSPFLPSETRDLIHKYLGNLDLLYDGCMFAVRWIRWSFGYKDTEKICIPLLTILLHHQEQFNIGITRWEEPSLTNSHFVIQVDPEMPSSRIYLEFRLFDASECSQLFIGEEPTENSLIVQDYLIHGSKHGFIVKGKVYPTFESALQGFIS